MAPAPWAPSERCLKKNSAKEFPRPPIFPRLACPGPESSVTTVVHVSIRYVTGYVWENQLAVPEGAGWEFSIVLDPSELPNKQEMSPMHRIVGTRASATV